MPQTSHNANIVWPLKPLSLFVIAAFLIVDASAWVPIVKTAATGAPRKPFVWNGSHGDAVFVMLPFRVGILVDGGKDRSIIDDLAKTPAAETHHIDLVVISDPEIARFGGLASVLEEYSIGAIAYDGRNALGTDVPAWKALMQAVAAKGIPLITLGAGDRILINGHEAAAVLAPDREFASSADVRDGQIVLYANANGKETVIASHAQPNVLRTVRARYPELRPDAVIQ
ncbi:MAG TPA: hypothetical protein VMT99_01345 [Candidatus Paceibacterota bacterium]|nr:hypothetical protein [Candidatus Paceibacterota bacterium]